jgi:hypothetical protein
MQRPTKPPTVAVFNGDQTVLDELTQGFARAGVQAIAALAADLHSREDALSFLRGHGARAIVYEVPPPDEQGWTRFQRLYRAAQALGAPLILTAIPGQAGAAEAAPASRPTIPVDDTVRLVCRILGVQDPTA